MVVSGVMYGELDLDYFADYFDDSVVVDEDDESEAAEVYDIVRGADVVALVDVMAGDEHGLVGHVDVMADDEHGAVVGIVDVMADDVHCVARVVAGLVDVPLDVGRAVSVLVGVEHVGLEPAGGGEQPDVWDCSVKLYEEQHVRLVHEVLVVVGEVALASRVEHGVFAQLASQSLGDADVCLVRSNGRHAHCLEQSLPLALWLFPLILVRS